MGFLRARSDEQKTMRLQQIAGAAADLFDSGDYDKITLAAIAKKLDFSRVNLYKYVSTKEEIFLYITADELDAFFEDLHQTFAGCESLPVGEFSRIWAEVLYRHKRLLKLASILFSIIEKNVAAARLAEFKRRLFVGIDRLYPLVRRLLPGLPEGRIMPFLDYQLHYIAGLYPSTELNEVQNEAIRLSGIPYEAKDFVAVFSGFLSTILAGLSA